MPDGRVTVTKDSIGGTGPITSLELPDDGGEPIAEDWRNVAAVGFKNLAWALSGANVEYTLHLQNTTSPFVIGPPNLFSGPTWTDSAITLDIDVLDPQVNDDLKITVWGTWQYNTGAAGVIGEMRVKVVEDVDGTPATTAVPGMTTIVDDGTGHTEAFSIYVRHRITTAGKARVVIQLRSEDLTGGAGTATLILVFSARLDVTHVRRST